jgi:two-component system, NarL family, sensor kinase
MKLNKLIFFLLFIGGFFSCFSQNLMNKDSLLKLLSYAKEDSNKVNLLFDVGESFESSKPEIAKNYYEQARVLSKKINYTKGEIKFASYYTSVLNMQGDFNQSLKINLNALQLAKKLNNPLILGKVTLNTGNSYKLLMKNDSAIFYYMQALPIFDKIGNKRFLAIAYSNLQMIYQDLKQYQKGIEYGLKALNIFRQDVDDPQNLSYCLTNLGNLYSSLEQPDKAIKYYNEALSISQKIGNQYAESALLLNIGDYYYKKHQFETSKNYFEQALGISNELKLYESKTIALKAIAMYSLQTHKINEAIMYADSALIYSINYNNRQQRQKIYKLLSDISYASGDMLKAEEFDILDDQINDSINNDNLLEITTKYEKQYETQKKDLKIREQQATLKQQKTLQYLFGSIAIAMLIIAGLGYRNYRHRQKLQKAKITELETEKQLAATEAVLRGEEQERSRIAKDLHDGLGGMLSGVKYSFDNMKNNLIMTPENAQAFEKSIYMLDSSIKEMRRVAHNMVPEILLKYGLDSALKEFCNDIGRTGALQVNYQSIDLENKEFDQTLSISVYRIIQELCNNVLKHADAKNLLIQTHADSENKLLLISVEDDGKGMGNSSYQKTEGMGWKNIYNRVELLKGKIDVNSSPENGTSVLIEIPIV